MKRVFLAIALTLGVMGANAQNVEQPEKKLLLSKRTLIRRKCRGTIITG